MDDRYEYTFVKMKNKTASHFPQIGTITSAELPKNFEKNFEMYK